MHTRMPALRGALAAAIAGLAVIAGASVALAHAQYATSSPAANSTVTSVPSTLQVTYSEELSAIQITLTGPDGSNAASGTASIDLAHRTNASIALRDAGPGQYSVVWHNVSGDDGDPNDGAFVFTVAAAAGQAQPAPAAAPSNAPATATSSGQAAPRASTTASRHPASVTCASTPTASARRSATSSVDRSTRRRSTASSASAWGWRPPLPRRWRS